MTRQRGKALIWRWLASLLCVLIYSTPQLAEAHNSDESYLFLIVDEGPLKGYFHIGFHNLAKVTVLDSNGDGVISDDEVKDNYETISSHLQLI